MAQRSEPAINATGYRLLAFTALLAFTITRLWQRGMFLDGMVYAVLARNLSIGIGSVWAPAYGATDPQFLEQPPLGLAIEAIPFFLFGDHFAVERAFSVFLLLVHGMIIMAIWRRLFPSEYDWLPLLFWILPSIVTWAVVNNMLENIQALFTSVAMFMVICASARKSAGSAIGLSMLAGLAGGAAVLIKGPVGFFPLAVPLALPLLPSRGHRGRSSLWAGAGLLAGFAAWAWFVVANDGPRDAVAGFARTHLIPALEGTRGDRASVTDVVRHLVGGIAGRMALVVGVLWLLGRRVATSENSGFRASLFALAVALLASVPILISRKVAGHHFLASVPFFAIAAAGFALPVVQSFAAGTRGRWGRRIPVVLSAGLALAAALVLLLHGTLERRNEDLIRSLDAISASAPVGQAAGTCSASDRDWGLFAYGQRFFRLTLVPRDMPVDGWFLLSKGACQPPAGCRIEAEGPRLELHRCEGRP